jgi:hypothetical protein
MKQDNSVVPGVKPSGIFSNLQAIWLLVLRAAKAADEAEMLKVRLWKPGKTTNAAHKHKSQAPFLASNSNRAF